MQRLTDERLIAYLDGELDESERAAVMLALEEDGSLRDRAARLSESAALLRAAFDEVLREPLPEQLIAAAHGESKVTELAQARARRYGLATSFEWILRGERRWQAAVAASLLALLIGGGGGYWAALRHGGIAGEMPPGNAAQAGNWLDNIAGYHKLFVNAGPDSTVPVDGIHPPNLKPWGLEFQSARTLFIEGRPATQFFYTTDNQQLGPLTVVVASTTKPDMEPAWEHRDDVNLLNWRHRGHAYALVGTADFGYLWNIHKDIAWQLDAI